MFIYFLTVSKNIIPSPLVSSALFLLIILSLVQPVTAGALLIVSSLWLKYVGKYTGIQIHLPTN